MGIRIAGIVKSSLIDFPGKACAVIFLQACNFRCGYCHNPELVFGDESASKDELTRDSVIEFLRKRKRFLDGVCISGGEPTLSTGLTPFVAELKLLGYEIKLDTNGSSYWVLQNLIEKGLLDYVAMDIKGPYEKYQEIAGPKADIEAIKNSAKLLAKEYNEGKLIVEFRTTVCREQLTYKDLEIMLSEHPKHPPWYLQKFNNPGRILDEKNTYSAYSDEEMLVMGEKLCVSVR